jgi:hypothetical protein
MSALRACARGKDKREGGRHVDMWRPWEGWRRVGRACVARARARARGGGARTGCARSERDGESGW